MKRTLSLLLAAVLMLTLLLGGCGAERASGTDLARLDITGDLQGMADKSDVRQVRVEFRRGELQFESWATMKLQGTSSLAYDKKNYTLKLYADEAREEKLPVDLGWGAQSEYCLKASWVDKTISRNVVSAQIVTQVQQKYGVLENAPTNCAVDGFPAELYVNGEYLGLYSFNIPKAPWLFAMDEDNPDHIVFCGEAWEPTNKFKAMPDLENWSVEVGSEDEQSLAKLGRLFDFVINADDETFIRDFGSYMDLDAAMHYYILADFLYLTDNMGKNMLLATYDGQVWYPLLYDLDSSWGSESHGLSKTAYEEKGLSLSGNRLFQRLEECFPGELSRRYFELREDILTEEHIMGQFEAFRAQIPQEAFDREMKKWGKDRPGFDYSQIEQFLEIIIPRLDEKYAAME